MIRKKENKKYVVAVIVLSILLLVALIFLFILGRYYYKDINKPEYGLGDTNLGNNSCSMGDVEKIDISYIIDKKKMVEFDKLEGKFLDKYQGRKYIEYPVIIGAHNSILDLNDKIKEKVDAYINDFASAGEIINNETNPDEICYVKVLDDKTQINYCSYYSLEYDIYTSDKYISIIEDRVFNTEIATGFSELSEIYTVDKSTGIVVSNEDVVKDINNLSIMKNDLIKYIKENYINLEYYKVSEISKEDFLADLDILLSTNSFKVFFEDESIYFYFSKIQGVDGVVFKYTSDKWEEIWDMYSFL